MLGDGSALYFLESTLRNARRRRKDISSLLFVTISWPSSAFVRQAGTGFCHPLTSTRHIRPVMGHIKTEHEKTLENFSSIKMRRHSHTAFGSNSGWKHSVGTRDLLFLMASSMVAPGATSMGWPSTFTFRRIKSLAAADATVESAGAAACFAFWAICLVIWTALIMFLSFMMRGSAEWIETTIHGC